MDVKCLLKEETFKLAETGRSEGTLGHPYPGTHTYHSSLHPPQRSSAAPRLGAWVQGPALGSAVWAPMATGPALSATACSLEAVSLAVETAALAGRPKPGWGVQVNSKTPPERPQL